MKFNAALFVSIASAVLLYPLPAQAHFPWLTIAARGKASYFFGESPAEQTYKLPGPIAKAHVQSLGIDGKLEPVVMVATESDDFVGMRSAKPVQKNATLISQVTYGVYQGSRLEYYTAHQGGALPKNREAYESAKSPLDLTAELVDSDSGVDVYILWKGKPLSDVEVRLFCEDGHEESAGETDKAGKVSFNDREVEDGLNGIMVGHTVNGQSGELGDHSYESVSHYLTVTFLDPEDFE